MSTRPRNLYVDHKAISRAAYQDWAAAGRRCVWCASPCSRVLDFDSDVSGNSHFSIWGCQSCGWWTYSQFIEPMLNYKYRHHGLGVLRALDLGRANLPIGAIRDHLIRHYDDRRHISAQAAEDLVRSVFKDVFDCEVTYFRGTANTPDGGVDLVVANLSGSAPIAVQVKRRIARPSESVNEIRDFVGALMVEGFNKGIFVTTAKYSPAALSTVNRIHMSSLGLSMDLVDGDRLLDLLKENRASLSGQPWTHVIGSWALLGFNVQHPPVKEE